MDGITRHKMKLVVSFFFKGDDVKKIMDAIMDKETSVNNLRYMLCAARERRSFNMNIENLVKLHIDGTTTSPDEIADKIAQKSGEVINNLIKDFTGEF